MSGEKLRAALYECFDDEAFMTAHLNARSLADAVMADPGVRAALAAPSTPEPSGPMTFEEIDAGFGRPCGHVCGIPQAEHRHEEHQWASSLRAAPSTEPAPDAALSILPTFEVAQVVGELQPGRRRHDWCSMHGDVGPMESINEHALRAHGSSPEAIRKARKALKRAARLAESQR